MNLMHPLTCTTYRYIVGDRFHGVKTSGHKKDTCKYHHMDLCPELKQYKSVTSEVINSKIKSVRLQNSIKQNIVHYFLYNRLMDYWHNRNIIDKQYQTMLVHAHPGETVTRDDLHHFMYINITDIILAAIIQVILVLKSLLHSGYCL